MNIRSFKKSDFKTGMAVKTTKGIFLVISNSIGVGGEYEGETLFVNKDYGAIPLSKYNDRFDCQGNNNFDILEIRKIKEATDMFENPKYEEMEVLWKESFNITYVTGVGQVSEGESTWKLGGTPCNIGDALEVQTPEGRDIIIVTKMFLSEDVEGFDTVTRRVYKNYRKDEEK